MPLKRKASQDLGIANKRLGFRASRTTTNPALKRKSSSDLASHFPKRRAPFSDLAIGERSKDPAPSMTAMNLLGTWDILPTEIICEIISWSSIPAPDAAVDSLYALTRVSKTMASLTLPVHIEINSHRLPSLSLYHIGLNGDQFNLFPAWVRSDRFASREEFLCYFTSPNIKTQIGAFDTGLSSMRPEDRPKSLEFNGDLDVKQALSLLDIAGSARAHSVELEVFHLDLSLPQAVSGRTIRKLAHLEKLKIEWPTLSSDHWRLLLEAVVTPNLKTLTLIGAGVPWNALASFLSRHSTILELHLPASDITRLSRRHRALQMPHLHRLEGKLAKVVSLMKLLTKSAITSIHGEIPSNTPLVQTIEEIITTLATCNSNISLVANLTSTKPNGSLAQIRPLPARTLRKWRLLPDRLAQLRRLRLIVVGIDNSTLLTCDTFLIAATIFSLTAR
ncbi:hypothetical protein HWV62_4982 [Athelia sp. TMB]|nr:hypothetical protein HWV62_4982 [Athelia sp. TMB]